MTHPVFTSILWTCALGCILGTPSRAEEPTTECVSSAQSEAISLTFVGCEAVSRPEGSALSELSGLTAESGTGWLWLLSDNKKNLYRMDSNGGIGDNDQGNKIDLGNAGDDLEGVVYRNGFLYAVQEGAYSVVKASLADAEGLKIETFNVLDLACEEADSQLCGYLKTSASNSRLEGITFGNSRFFLVKEKDPGLLIEVSRDLDKILDYTVLNCGSYDTTPCDGDTPFPDSVGGSTQDFSGLSFDPVTGRLWIVSDTAGAVFLYDVETGAYDTFPLTVVEGDTCSLIPEGADRCMAQAEGVAYVEGDVLKVVNDRQDVTLSIAYEFKIHRRQ